MSNKIKLLFILRMLGFGGAERQVVELCQGLDKNRFDITVALFFDDGEGYLEDLKKTSVVVKILADKKSYKFNVLSRLIKLMRQEQFNIVHTFLPIPNLIGGLAARLAKQKIVVGSIRNANPFSWTDIFCLMDRVALNLFCDNVIANSQTGAQMTIEKYGVKPVKVFVIRNGKNFVQYTSLHSAGKLKENLNIPSDCKVITTIGRITRQKGHRYLIEAADILVHRQKLKLHFLVVGKAEESYSEMESLIRKFNLESCVHRLGVRRDIGDLLNISDVFVLPSLWEGLANVLLEAMACGVPVVASDISSNREVVEHDKTGLLFPPQNAAALAAAIERVVSDPLGMRPMAQRGRETILTKFDLTRLVKQHQDFYQSLLQNEKIRTSG